MFDLIVVGNLTIDCIIRKGTEPVFMPGGSAAYASLAAKRMGADVLVSSKVGPDFPKQYISWLSRSGIDLAGLRRVKAPTTHFILKYDGEKRELQLKSSCEPISFKDIPANIKTKGIHVGPVAGEISVETVTQLAELAENISLDSQGFVRIFDDKGYAKTGKRLETKVLERVDVLKATEEEVKVAVGVKDVWKAMETVSEFAPKIVIVTRGIAGAFILIENSRYEVPAFKTSSIVDPTGAGDAFMGAFMAEYVQGKNPLWCAAVGSASASLVIEAIGPSFAGSKDDVLKRAEEVRGGIRKL
ncbi:MAG TPA: PfkB family carbohydrate kinase [archaeon]|nr:PfkB family carbohydrate kinase [archaeon]